MPNSSQQNAYYGALSTGRGVIYDQLGNAAVVGAQMPVGAANGYVLTSDANGNLTLQPASGGGGGTTLVPTAVKTSGYTAAASDFVPCDTTSAGFTVTLPTAPADKTQIGVKIIAQASSHAVTVAAGGSDVFNVASGATTLTLSLLYQGVILQYKASSAIWYVLSDDLALGQLDLRYLALSGGTLTGSLAVGGALSTTPFVLTDAATITVDASKSDAFRVTLGGNRTLQNPSNPTDGQAVCFEVIQDGTGSRTLAYDTAYSFPASIGTPVLSTTAGFHDFLAFRYDATATTWYCVGFVPQAVNATPYSVAQGGTGDSSLTAYAVLAGGTTSTGALQQVSGTGTSAQVLTSNGASALPTWQTKFYGGIFGTGADGSVTFDGSTTVLGLAPSSSIYTLTRDIHCTSITINNGVTVKNANFRIFCRGTITNNGTISNNGNNASAGTGGTGTGASSTSGGRTGGNGGTGVSGAGVAGTAASLGATGGAGGNGTSGAGAAGGTVTQTSTIAQNNMLQTPWAALMGESAYNSANLQLQFGAGGGGGGSDASSNAGGGGGGGAGIVILLAWAVNNGSGTISANGGNGANGVAGNAGGGGGGAGGAVLAYTLSAWTAGTATASGGTHGTHAGTGSDGSDGNAGLVLNVVVG